MSAADLAGWEKLSCLFFSRACRRVLGRYLESNGFSERSVDRIGIVTFSRFGIFLEIGYELEMAPNYMPTVVLGIGEGKYDKKGQPSAIPFWYLIPSDRPESKYSLWTFKTEAELETALARIKDEVLEVHAKPLWSNLEKLEKVISNFRAEFSGIAT